VAGRAKLVGQVVAVALVAGLLGLLAWNLLHSEEGVRAALRAGESPDPPDFTLERLDRKGTLRLASTKGRPVVLNFWASWCIPCKEEAPFLESVWRRYRDEGLLVIGVNVQDFRADARTFMRAYGITYPNVYDGKGSTIGRYGITGVPETFFIDRRGRLVPERIAGPVDDERFRSRFDAALAKVLAPA
jgi:cytochrome c biogenesis protein CcmG/thiol:disulfide interchange protein DsbE